MFGLFLRTFDQFMWEDLVAVSRDEKKLRGYYGELDPRYPLFEYEEAEEHLERDDEVGHYVIMRVKEIK